MKKLIPVVLAVEMVFLCFSPAFGARKALLIGIADYQALPSYSKQGISDLRGSINDVKAIKESLITYYEFSTTDIKVLTDETATCQNIKAAFDEWLVRGTKHGDTTVLYFSGHGSTVPDQNGDEQDGFDEVLCPCDMIPKGGYNIILDDELALWLKRLNGRRAVVIIDSCHSGGQTRSIGQTIASTLEDTPSKRARFIPISDYQPSSIAMARPRGSDVPNSVIFMAASREDEIALEVSQPDGFHGGFSFGLCDGMKSSPRSSYEKLFDHAKDVVKDRLRLTQEPQLMANRNVAMERAFRDIQKNKPALHSEPEDTTETGPRPDQTNGYSVTSAQPVTNEAVSSSEQTGTHPGKPLLEAEIPHGSSHDQDSRPVAPPEIVGTTVLVAMDQLRGCNTDEMQAFRQGISQLSIVDMVGKDEFFDRVVRGEKRNGMYHVRLINGIGDVETISPRSSIDQVVNNITDHFEYAFMVKQLGRIHHPASSFKVKAWVTDKNRRDFWVGENIVFGVRAERDCHIILINLDSQGNFHIIYPNSYHQDNFIAANTNVLIPDKAMRRSQFQFVFGAPTGEETIKVIATIKPIDLIGLGIGGFRQAFQNISGETRTVFVKKVVNNLSSGDFEWSEDEVVIRSHKRKNR